MNTFPGKFINIDEIPSCFCYVLLVAFCCCRLWDVHNPHSPLLDTILHHTEFTYGLSFSPFIQGRVRYTDTYSRIKLILPATINSTYPHAHMLTVQISTLSFCIHRLNVPLFSRATLWWAYLGKFT